MGAGVSSMNRLRKALVMRAYNVRENHETLEEFFRKHSYRKNGQVYISLNAVKKALSVNAQWIDELFARVLGGDDYDFEFSDFMEFLETGKMPLPPTQKPPPIRTSSSAPLSSTRPGSLRKDSPPTPPRKTPPRPRAKEPMKRSQSIAIPDFNPITSTIYPGVIKALQLNTLPYGVHDRALVLSKGSAVALNFKDSYRAPLPSKPLWRKREVVRQERTVHYTTVDAEGVLQELVERELSQTEVLHMECRETGEFAHRESTDYEHYETFNNEVVTETRGNEEYVHLKSLEDEYEYMESNMPHKQPPPEEVPQFSPNATAAGQDGETFVEEPDDDRACSSPLGLNPDNWSGRHPTSANGRRGYTGDYDNDPNGDDSSPPLSSTSYNRENGGQKGNLWSSFGGEGGDWIPPPRDHTSSGLLNEEDLENEERNGHIPAGKRRPDLFESSSSPSPVPYPPPSKEYFDKRRGSHGSPGKDKKSNQYDDDDDDRDHDGGDENENDVEEARESKYLPPDSEEEDVEEEGSPFQNFGKSQQLGGGGGGRGGGSNGSRGSRRGSREELKQWGSEDDID